MLFSQSSFKDAQFFENNMEAFHHLFIRGYECGEVKGLYNVDDVFDQLAFTVHQVSVNGVGVHDLDR